MKHWPEAFSLYREFEDVRRRATKATETLVKRSISDYKDYSGPPEELPYVVRVLRRGEIPEDHLSSEIQSVIMAGLDTTFHVLLWNMLHLAQRPGAQQSLREEILRVLGPEANFTRDKMSEMPYLKAVMRETQRITPALPIMTFRFLDQDISLCGYRIPAQTRITMAVEPIQKDPRIVDDAQVFMPERFLPAAVEARKDDPLKSLIDHKLLSTPFSFGARMCLGARLAEVEIMTLLSKFVSRFHFEYSMPNQPWTKTMRTMSCPVPVPQVKFTPI